jgi:type IV fimbrial biogenesis protein FimT
MTVSVNCWRSLAPPSASGLTLIEVLVSLAIVGILASLAAPSFQEMIQRHRSKAMVEDLTAVLQLAKAEAIRRAVPVILERTASCDVALEGANDWSCGWQLYADANRDEVALPAELIQTRSGASSHRMTHNMPGGGSGPRVAFTRWGHTQPASQRFVVEPRSGSSAATARTLCLNAAGRLRILDGVVECA